MLKIKKLAKLLNYYQKDYEFRSLCDVNSQLKLDFLLNLYTDLDLKIDDLKSFLNEIRKSDSQKEHSFPWSIKEDIGISLVNTPALHKWTYLISEPEYIGALPSLDNHVYNFSRIRK